MIKYFVEIMMSTVLFNLKVTYLEKIKHYKNYQNTQIKYVWKCQIYTTFKIRIYIYIYIESSQCTSQLILNL